MCHFLILNGFKVSLTLKSNHCPFFGSYHGPFIVNTDLLIPFKSRLFRFENLWLHEKNCNIIVSNAWNQSVPGLVAFSLLNKLKIVKGDLKKWNNNYFRNIDVRISMLTKELKNMKGLQKIETSLRKQNLDRNWKNF